MTGLTFRHWLTGFVSAALAHLILAAFLMGFWREPVPESGSAERAGLEVTLLPGFHEAVQRIAAEVPPFPADEPLPPEVAVEPAPPDALMPPDLASDEVRPLTADASLASESPAPVPARPVLPQPPPDIAPVPEPVFLAEIVEATPATETSEELVRAAAVRPELVPDAAGVPRARTELTAEPVVTLQPEPLSPSEVALETVAGFEPAGLAGILLPQSAPAPAPPADLLQAEPSETAPPAVPGPVAATEDAPVPVVMARPVASVPVETAEDAALAASLAESVPLAETVESIEAVALIPESEAGAPETSPASTTVENSGSVREESTGALDPPATEAAPDARQTPGIEDRYFRALREWLDRHKDYPRVAQRRGEEGTVVLAFTLNRFGMVLEHAIVRSSGHTILDNTVEHLIRRAQPLPAIPPEMNVELLQVIVPIEFRLER